jgi:hypothetical protein
MQKNLKLACAKYTRCSDPFYFFHDRLSCSEMASRKSSVLRYMPSFTFESPWMHAAKSLVILPPSTVSTQACSRAFAKRPKSGLLSSFARCSKPVGTMSYIFINQKLNNIFTSGPCKDRSDWVGGSWFALLVLSVMTCDSSMGSF